MGFYEVANHPLIYTMVICGIIFVLGFTGITFLKSWRRAILKGYTREQLMKVIKSALVITVVPAMSIVLGLFSLSANALMRAVMLCCSIIITSLFLIHLNRKQYQS